MRVLVLLLLGTLLLHAQVEQADTKSEIEHLRYLLKTQEIAARNTADELNRQLAANAELKRHIEQTAKNTTTAIHKDVVTNRIQIGGDLQRVIDSVQESNDNNADTAEKSQESLKAIHDQVTQNDVKNQERADEIKRNNTTLFITGMFGFLGLLIPVLIAWNARVKDHQSMMDTIALKKAEGEIALASRPQQTKKEELEDVLRILAATKAKIKELESEVAVNSRSKQSEHN